MGLACVCHHSLITLISFSVCVCQALGTTPISDGRAEQTNWALPPIDGDQSLRFDLMTIHKQQLKVRLMLIASGQLPKPKCQGIHWTSLKPYVRGRAQRQPDETNCEHLLAAQVLGTRRLAHRGIQMSEEGFWVHGSVKRIACGAAVCTYLEVNIWAMQRVAQEGD